MSAFAADDLRIDVWYWPRQGADRLLGALGRCVGRAVDPAELVRTVDGQPRLRRSELAFSISHSGAWTAVAVSHAPVGIDLERVVPLPELHDVAALAFTPAERHGLARCAAPLKETWFYDCWTRKEALAKAMGCGFRDGPQSVDTAAAPGWRFIRWSPEPGYAGCVATRLDRPHVVVRGVPNIDPS
jgi:4'-phosphopantetheinyl transferase